jgi:hypothetical protein
MDREQLAQARPFVGREVFRALEQQPSRLGEHGISSTLSEKADFRAADLVDALTELLCDCGIRSRIRTAHRRRSHECRREADVPSPQRTAQWIQRNAMSQLFAKAPSRLFPGKNLRPTRHEPNQVNAWVQAFCRAPTERVRRGRRTSGNLHAASDVLRTLVAQQHVRRCGSWESRNA